MRAGVSAPGGAKLARTTRAAVRTMTAFFLYGLTASCGQQTPVQSLGNGLLAQTMIAALENLLPGAVYHFRVVATGWKPLRAHGPPHISPGQRPGIPVPKPLTAESPFQTDGAGFQPSINHC